MGAAPTVWASSFSSDWAPGHTELVPPSPDSWPRLLSVVPAALVLQTSNQGDRSALPLAFTLN